MNQLPHLCTLHVRPVVAIQDMNKNKANNGPFMFKTEF